MPDREKVLKALEHHKETAVCNGCPYAGDDDTPQGNCPVYDDAIAILREQEPVTMPGWVSVKDKLPEQDGVYIVYDGEFVYSAVYERSRPVNEWADDHEGYCDFDVTHWMPLPEAPKE